MGHEGIHTAANAEKLYAEHNAAVTDNSQPHVDPKMQCQCDGCKTYRGEKDSVEQVQAKEAKAAADAKVVADAKAAAEAAANQTPKV